MPGLRSTFVCPDCPPFADGRAWFYSLRHTHVSEDGLAYCREHEPTPARRFCNGCGMSKALEAFHPPYDRKPASCLACLDRNRGRAERCQGCGTALYADPDGEYAQAVREIREAFGTIQPGEPLPRLFRGRRDRRYCSPACRVRAYRARSRA